MIHKRAAGGVVLAGGRVLVILKRANGEIRLPKGTVDPGESDADAALREVREETGFADLSIEADLGCETVRFRLADGPRERHERYYRMALGTCRRVPRKPKDGFRFQVLWMPADEALERLSFDDERRFLERALATP